MDAAWAPAAMVGCAVRARLTAAAAAGTLPMETRIYVLGRAHALLIDIFPLALPAVQAAHGRLCPVPAGGHVGRQQGDAGTKGRHYQRARTPTGGPRGRPIDWRRGLEEEYVVAAGWAVHSPRRIARAAAQHAARGDPRGTPVREAKNMK